MPLDIYSVTDGVSKFSQNNTFTAPLLETLDGRTGGSIERLLYIRNNDPGLSFTGITIQPVMDNGTSIVDGTNGFYWKLSAGATQPTDDEWLQITSGDEITLDDLGNGSASDTATYLPFWVRIAIPRNARIQTYTNVKLKIVATQISV